MTTTPFRCEKSGEALSVDKGGKCSLCCRLLSAKYLRQALYMEQRSPICVDCIEMIADHATSFVRDELVQPLPRFTADK